MTDPAPEMPPPLRRAGNLARAVARHAADWLAEVGPAELAGRLAACRDCPLRRPADWVCQHPDCGCYIQIKARWRSEDCPLGRWGAEAAPAGGPPPGGGCGCG